MPAPIDISAALGSDPGVGPAPEPGGSMDFGLDDPMAGLVADEEGEAEDLGEEQADPEFKTMATELFPDWDDEDFLKFQRLIDLRAGKGDMGMEMP